MPAEVSINKIMTKATLHFEVKETSDWLILLTEAKQAEFRKVSETHQLTLPLSVLISPLCPKTRIGWARSQLGNVLVENLECICKNNRRTGALVHN